MRKLTGILAVDNNLAFGLNGSLPWNIPDDLRRFKARTLGCPIIMGSKTFESVAGPHRNGLPGRENYVVSSRKVSVGQNVDLVRDLETAILDVEIGQVSEEAFVIGGLTLFRQAWEHLTHLDLTIISGEHEADTFFRDLGCVRAWEITGIEEASYGRIVSLENYDSLKGKVYGYIGKDWIDAVRGASVGDTIVGCP